MQKKTQQFVDVTFTQCYLHCAFLDKPHPCKGDDYVTGIDYSKKFGEKFHGKIYGKKSPEVVMKLERYDPPAYGECAKVKPTNITLSKKKSKTMKSKKKEKKNERSKRRCITSMKASKSTGSPTQKFAVIGFLS